MSEKPDRELHASDSAKGSDALLEPLGQMVVGLDHILLAEAERAAARSEAAAAGGSAHGVAGGTAAAVLLAAAACEARLSEYLATMGVTLLPDEDRELVRKQRDAVAQWCLLLSLVDPSFPRGGREVQALSCLNELRDKVAHRQARYLPALKWPDALEDCVRQREIPVIKKPGDDWTSVTYVAAVARWASNTARDWLALMTKRGIVA